MSDGISLELRNVVRQRAHRLCEYCQLHEDDTGLRHQPDHIVGLKHVRKRLFMTATPRYFNEHVKRRAAELEFELVSMDDAHVFGPEFHVLTFHEAISAKPEPLLTDYQVVVIGVTDREAKAWAERATLVRIPARRGSELARRGSPDPAETHDRRSPLHAAQDSQTQKGDLRSDYSAESGDPRTAESADARTAQGFTTDARTLAAQIGLAKAMRK